ncbi:MAG TPA: flavin prenyltransferase UbiX [Pirellulaceae bacterium]|jgi:4-hydroxy-3-polyprenylbenzoate decarboxylase|nr:flavin prenyltransferase UbiX [Pirellulaceae bacterium]
MNHPLVLAITGASGAIYAVRLLELLLLSGRHVELTISPSASTVLKQELDCNLDLDDFRLTDLIDLDEHTGRLSYYHYSDIMAPIASGSHLTDGMVICPCSGTTLSGVAHGTSSNLIQRAADVHLKERRTLILVPRETPLSIIQLDSMRQAAQAGAVILPASPGWYHGVHAIQDLVDFVVARILDHLRISHQLMRRWGGDEDAAGA